MPKVGSTVWKRALGLLSGHVTDNIIHSHLQSDSRTKENPSKFVHRPEYYQLAGLRKLASYDKDEQIYRLKNYNKFFLVRNPLERLYSAYHDKFLVGDTGVTDDFYRKHANLTMNISFATFLNAIITDLLQNRSVNEHWRPFYQLCSPCIINYDYIGTINNMVHDAEFIVKNMLHKTSNISSLFNPLNGPSAQRHHVNTSKRAWQAYAKVSSEIRHKVCKAYHADFTLFGYDCHIVPDS